jgi:hypothetical protein
MANVGLALALCAGISAASAQTGPVIVNGDSLALNCLTPRVPPTPSRSETISTGGMRGTPGVCHGLDAAASESGADTAAIGVAFSVAATFEDGGSMATGAGTTNELTFSLIVDASGASTIGSASRATVVAPSGGPLWITETGFPTGFGASPLPLPGEGTGPDVETTPYESPPPLEFNID